MTESYVRSTSWRSGRTNATHAQGKNVPMNAPPKMACHPAGVSKLPRGTSQC
jgi:hypothetical protein